MNEIILKLNKRIETLELLLAANTKKIAQYGVVAPAGTVVPAFIGQIYVNTATQKAYAAYGLTNADWTILN